MNASLHRALRVSAAVVALAALSAGASAGLVPGSSGPVARSAPGDELDTSSIARLGSCLAGGGQGDVLFVFDTSGSLSTEVAGDDATDPTDQRVAAASYLVDQLAAYVGQSDGTISIDVATAGFAVDFDGPGANDWTTLDPGSAGAVKDQVADYRDRDTGFETDYWAAANGASEALRDRRGGEARHCQAWVWFSDGQLDLDARESDADVERYGDTKPYGPSGLKLTSDGAEKTLEKSAEQALCGRTGVASGLRGQGIITLAVGLKGAAADTGADTFRVMEGIATGSGDCGREPQQSPGLFVEATSVSDLYFAFDTLSDPGNLPFSQRTEVCQGDVCEEGKQRFVLDDSIDQISLLAASDVEGYQAVLEPPGSKRPVVLESDVSEPIDLGGAAGTVTWINDKVVSFELVKKSATDNPQDKGWRGEWSIVFVDPESASDGMTAGSNLRLYGNLYPNLAEVGTPVAGVADNPISIDIRRGPDGGEVVDPANIGNVSLELALVYPDGTEVDPQTLDADDLGQPVSLDLTEATPGDAIVKLTLSVTTTPVEPGQQGTALEPRSVEVSVPLAAPPSYPKVAGEVDFGSTDEAGSITRTVTTEDKGCVWLDVDSVEEISLPDGVDTAPISSSADSEETCVKGDLPVTIDLDEVGTGLASGTFQVRTKSDDDTADGTIIPVTVSYGLTMERPRDTERFIVALVLITLGGILIPIALLYLVKWRTSQLAGRSLTILSVSGDVGPDSSFLLGVQPREQDGRTVALDGNRRGVQLGARAELRTRMGIGLTEAGYATVVGAASASSRSPSTTRKGVAARLPLAAQDSWIVLVDPANPLGPVEVLFLLSPTGGQLNNLVVDARSRVPETVGRLRDKLGSGATPPAGGPAGPAGPSDGGWGGGGGGGGGWGGSDGSPSTPAAPAPAASPGGGWGGGSDGGWGSSPAPQPPRPPGGGSDGW